MNLHRDRGFTLIELLIVVVIIGILANLAIPAYGAVRDRARATKVVGDVNAIEIAAYGYLADEVSFPATSIGSAPAGLDSYLPSDFTFIDGETTLGWVNSGGGAIGTYVKNGNPVILQFVADSHSGPIVGSPASGTLILIVA